MVWSAGDSTSPALLIESTPFNLNDFETEPTIFHAIRRA